MHYFEEQYQLKVTNTPQDASDSRKNEVTTYVGHIYSNNSFKIVKSQAQIAKTSKSDL